MCVLDMTCTVTMATDVAELRALDDTTRIMVHNGCVSWTRKTDLYDGVRLEFRQLHLDVVQLLLPQDPAGRPSPHSRGGGLHPLLDARDAAAQDSPQVFNLLQPIRQTCTDGHTDLHRVTH